MAGGTVSAAMLRSMAGDNSMAAVRLPRHTHKWLACALVAPGLAGRLPSAAIELPPAMALEDGCHLYDAAIVDG